MNPPDHDQSSLTVELPQSFVDLARSVGIDPQLLAAMMLECVSAYFARKLAAIIRRGRRGIEVEERGWPRDVEKVSTTGPEAW